MPNSHKGKFLIASPRLRDPNFFKAVVLLVQHDGDGALGLVMNRPMSVTVRQATENLADGVVGPETPLRIGGPCEGPLVAVHPDADLAEIEVLDGVYFSTEKFRVERVMADHAERALYFAGYAGWGGGQLEGELDEGSWLVVPATPQLIFTPARDLWGRLNTYATLGGTLDLDRIPDDPQVN
jgi:putative transcriptional regulator